MAPAHQRLVRQPERLMFVVPLLAMLLVLPSVWAGLHWDDYPIARHLQGWLNGDVQGPWWDTFNLDAPDPRRRFAGAVPWWTVDDLLARFFRPLAAATHLADNVLWPNSPWLMHAHSIAWFGAMVAAATRMYSRLMSSRLSLVSALVYSASYVHATPVGWISNRNAVLAGLFGFLAAASYIYWRSEDGRRFSWTPVFLVLSLLSAESGISVIGFVLAFEATTGRSNPSGRGWKLALLIGIVVAWRVAYSASGFGAFGSGGYIDPIRSPAVFAQEAPTRLLWLGAFLLTPLRILLADWVPQWAAFAASGLFVASAALAMRAAFRAENRLWTLSTLFCLFPLVASLPGERLLTFAYAAFSPVVASAILDRPWGRHVQRAAFATLSASYLLVSPAVLLLGSYNQIYDLEPKRQQPTMAELSSDEVRGRNLFVLYAPGQTQLNVMEAARPRTGAAMPAFIWNLFPTSRPPNVARVGCCKLRMSNPDGLSRGPFVVYFRGPDFPMEVGYSVTTLAFTATVESVTKSGLPTQVVFTFPENLESPRNLFVRWDGTDFVRVKAGDIASNGAP